MSARSMILFIDVCMILSSGVSRSTISNFGPS